MDANSAIEDLFLEYVEANDEGRAPDLSDYVSRAGPEGEKLEEMIRSFERTREKEEAAHARVLNNVMLGVRAEMPETVADGESFGKALLQREDASEIAERLKREWFPDHVANRIVPAEAGGIQIIRWKKPNTGFYFIRYMLCGNYLHVTGDVGDAIYRFGADIDWPDFLSLYVGYFASKCVASSCGAGYKMWWPEAAEQRLQEWINEDEDTDERAKRKLDLGSVDEYGDTGIQACQDKMAWYHWMLEFGDSVFEDCASEMYNIGEDVALQCIGHLAGLKMAIGQLQDQKRL